MSGIDLNADGADDLVVSAPDADRGVLVAGVAHVIFGPVSTSELSLEGLDGSNGFVVPGEERGADFGFVTRYLGDVNGDGVDDLGLAAPFFEGGTAVTSEGRVHVLFGSPTLGASGIVDITGLDGIEGFFMEGQEDQSLGRTVERLGDIDNDGLDDFFVGQPQGYEPWPSEPIRPDSWSNVCADFDQDGDTDVLVSESGWDTATLFFNAGDGTFPVSVSIPVQFDPVGVFAEDLDGNGSPDLLFETTTFSALNGQFSVLLNQGDGTFAPAVDYVVGSRFVVCELFDVDGDGDLDVAAAHHNQPVPANSLLVYKNNGSGAFSFSQAIQVPDEVVRMVALDYDRDDAVDLIFCADSTQQTYLALNDGAGSLLAPGPLPTTNSCRDELEAADLDGNGWEDLIQLSTGSCRVWMNGPGGFGPETAYEVPGISGNFLQGGCVLDLDGDGDLDLAVTDGEDEAAVLLNDGTGVFPEIYPVETHLNGGHLSAGDLDGDGFPDLVLSDGEEVFFAFNRGDGSFPGDSAGGGFVVFGSPTLGAGGFLDLSSIDPAQGFELRLGEGKAETGQSATSLGDVNGDGIDDFAISSPGARGERGQVHVIYGSPNLRTVGTLELPELSFPEGEVLMGPPGRTYFGKEIEGGFDFNGDGVGDFAVLASRFGLPGSGIPGRVWVLFGDPASTFSLDQPGLGKGFIIDGDVSEAGFADWMESVSDLDGDGCDELLISQHNWDDGGPSRGRGFLVWGEPASPAYWTLARRGSWATVFLGPDENLRLGWPMTAAGDLNGDGKNEVMVASRGGFSPLFGWLDPTRPTRPKRTERPSTTVTVQPAD